MELPHIGSAGLADVSNLDKDLGLPTDGAILLCPVVPLNQSLAISNFLAAPSKLRISGVAVRLLLLSYALTWLQSCRTSQLSEC